jgi:excisionase family DNA binding protein
MNLQLTGTQKMAYSVEEVAEQTTLSKSHLRNEIRDGKLKARKIGRRVLILNEDLQAYLKKGVETTN